MKRTTALVSLLLLAALLPLTNTKPAEAQVHSIRLLHIVPNGATATPGISTTAPASMDAVQQFLQRDIGRTLRVQTGVTRVQLAGGDISQIAEQLSAVGLDDPNTIYFGFVDAPGSDPQSCGNTRLPLEGIAAVALLWMPTCEMYPSQGDVFPNGPTFLLLHQVLHTLGAVPDCAPNFVNEHTNDSLRDVMSNDVANRDMANLTIDPGFDDYYNHSNDDCLDVADSPYWADAIAPPPGGAPTEEDVCDPSKITVNMNTNGGNGGGTPGDDVILGTPFRDVIVAGGGNDVICGGGGIDYIYAGPGQDIVFGGGGSDRIYGQGGIDQLFGGSGADRMFGGIGDDVMRGQGGQDSMWGEAGNDDLQGNQQSDRIWGGPGDDVLRGAGGKDKLYGEAGNDQLFGGNNQDYLQGGPGDDEANGQRGRDRPLVVDVSGCDAELLQSC